MRDLTSHSPVREGEHGHIGYRSEFIGLASHAVPLRMRAKAADLGWTDVGLLAIALGLKQEGDAWVAVHEGCAEVIRCLRDAEGATYQIEIRAEFLKDYLGAMGGMTDSMRAQLRMMDSTSAGQMKAMLPMHRQLVANML